METVGSHNANSRLSMEAELLKAGWPTGYFLRVVAMKKGCFAFVI